jgi:hypothetical protein
MQAAGTEECGQLPVLNLSDSVVSTKSRKHFGHRIFLGHAESSMAQRSELCAALTALVLLCTSVSQACELTGQCQRSLHFPPGAPAPLFTVPARAEAGVYTRVRTRACVDHVDCSAAGVSLTGAETLPHPRLLELARSLQRRICTRAAPQPTARVGSGVADLAGVESLTAPQPLFSRHTWPRTRSWPSAPSWPAIPFRSRNPVGVSLDRVC